MAETDGGGAKGGAGDNVREVEGYAIAGVLDAGMEADGRLVLVVEVDGSPLAFSMEPRHAEHICAIFLAQLAPGGVAGLAGDVILSGAAIEASAAAVTSPTDAAGPVAVEIARADGPPLRLSMPTAAALKLSRDLSRAVAASLRQASAG